MKETYSLKNSIEKGPTMKTLMTALTLVLSVSATANAQYENVRSGMLLGVYATPSQGGMRITSTIPGYSAQGRLFPGDVLMRATVDGWTMYNLRSHWEMENAKMAIGPNRDAGIEVWRPGHGYVYFMVQFTPIHAPAAASPMARSQRTYGAQFRTESEKPGARALFQRNGSRNQNTFPGQTSAPNPGRTSSTNSAAQLFGR